ncbi:YdcF family protein [Candidatus Dojkabacteria bacterium]|nr:YdcF family protein [Candidatus Dojkabacteria bacterium]
MRQNKRKIKAFKEKLKKILGSWKKILLAFFIIFLAIIFSIFLVNFWIAQTYSAYKHSEIEEVENTKVALVLGAGLWGDEPGPILEDRVLSAVDLYKAGKVEKLIMSGDNRTMDYDEPTAMVELAKAEGVPEAAIQPDYAGRRTYDSCLRAKEIFNVESAVIITQDFHLNRAMYICNSLGIEVQGFKADRRDYNNESWYEIRDNLATIKAIWEINVDPPGNVVKGDVIEL